MNCLVPLLELAKSSVLEHKLFFISLFITMCRPPQKRWLCSAQQSDRVAAKTIIAFIATTLILVFSARSLAQNGIQHSVEGPQIALSADALEALDHGVNLTFVSDFSTQRNWLFVQWKEQQHRHKFRLSKHSLSDRYLVHKDENPTPEIFRSSAQGVAYITKTTQDLFRNYAKVSPRLELRVALSKLELPAPLRLGALTSTNWSFDSGWQAWQSEIH